ncbi:dihydrofolate reductase [Peptoniphilus asaccharolyticus]
MFSIVNVDKNWGIGADNDMLINLKSDLEFFKETTMGKIVLMGRKTYETLPDKKPLPGRRNIILTRSDIKPEGYEIIHTPEEAMEIYSSVEPDNFAVIGGAEIYKMFLPYCEKAIITKTHVAFANVEKYFPNLDKEIDWKIETEGETVHDPQVDYHIVVYKNNNVKKWNGIEF